MYKRCIYKTGLRSYFCIDAGNQAAIKDKAIKLYTQLYVNFARFEHPTLPYHGIS
jgi:protein MBA1